MGGQNAALDMYCYSKVWVMLVLVYLTRVVTVGMMKGVLDLVKVMGAQLGHGGGSGQDVEIDVVLQGEGGGQVEGKGEQLFHGGGRGKDVDIDVVNQGEGMARLMREVHSFSRVDCVGTGCRRCWWFAAVTECADGSYCACYGERVAM